MSLLRGAAALLLLAAIAQARVPPGSTPRIQGNELIREEFAQWVAKHEKAYVNDVKEYARRFEIFADNLLYIMEHNSKPGVSYKLGANKFADMSHEEYKATQLGVRPGDTFKPTRQANAVAEFDYHDVVAPKEVDWRAKGAVSEVKNQLQCGSCWSFSTTGSVEGINAIKTGKLVSLSEQELVDCDTTHDHGCNGGLMDFAFDFIVANGGIDTEKDYAYKAVDEKCDIDKENTHVVSIDGHKDVPEGDEVALKKAIAMQPVSVAIEADQRDFQLYSSGVFDAPCGTALDHGVLAVGYGHQVTANGTTPYYIVKNSWGASWGDEGFILLKMGVGPSGICGIALSASYPLKTGPNPKPGPKPGPKPKPTPSPSPGPVQCDAMHSCPPDTTCCCSMELGNYCFAWGCCPSPEATCCDDHKHCCPKERPVCDVADATCAPSGAPEDKVPALKKLPATLDEAAAEAAGLKRVGGVMGGEQMLGPRIIRDPEA